MHSTAGTAAGWGRCLLVEVVHGDLQVDPVRLHSAAGAVGGGGTERHPEEKNCLHIIDKTRDRSQPGFSHYQTIGPLV